MTHLFLHGLGQNEDSWQDTLTYIHDTDTHAPNLFTLRHGQSMHYSSIYQNFSTYCDQHNQTLDLCGISLGAVLALNYTIDRPEKVNSLIIINGQYKMPKLLLSIQNGVFRILPESVFKDMGMSKTDAIQLMKSMKHINFTEGMSKITCPVLIVNGEKDKANFKASQNLNSIIEHSKMEIIKQAGHEINKDAPRALAGVINTFWSR